MSPQPPQDPGPDAFDPELKAHLLHDLAHSERGWAWERRVQRLLTSFALALLSVICLAIWASTLRPHISLHAFGDDRGGDGLSTGLRVVARDPRSGRILTPLRAEAWLGLAAQTPHAIDQVGIGPETVDVVLRLDPEQAQAHPIVRVIVETEAGTDDIEIPLRASQRTPPRSDVQIIDVRHTLKLQDDGNLPPDAVAATPILRDADPEVQLLLYPTSGKLIGVLGNDLWALALQEHQPRAGLRLRADPPGWTLVTNALGLARLRLTPGRGGGVIEWTLVPSASGAILHRPTSIRLKTVPQQIVARPRERVLPPGADWIVDLQSVRRTMVLSTEVYLGSRLLGCSLVGVQGGSAQLHLPLPSRSPALLALRLQGRPLGLDGVRDEVFALVHSGTKKQAWSWLLDELGDRLDLDPGLRVLRTIEPHTQEQAEQLIGLTLSRARIQATEIVPVAETRTRNQARADARRQTWQRVLFALYWLLGMGALALAVAAVWVHNRRQRARLMQLHIDEDMALEDNLDALSRRVFWELAGVIAGMVFGLVIVYLFISNLWWG